MSKTSLLNPELAAAVGELRHTDEILVAGATTTLPDVPTVLDLALTEGVPDVADVLDALRGETVIERAFAIDDAQDENPALLRELHNLYDHVHLIETKEFTKHARRVRLVVRTGDTAPHAGVVLHIGATVTI